MHLGNTFWLKSTVWTGNFESAKVFDTIEQAQAAFNKAKTFMKAAQIKNVTIKEMV